MTPAEKFAVRFLQEEALSPPCDMAIEHHELRSRHGNLHWWRLADIVQQPGPGDETRSSKELLSQILSDVSGDDLVARQLRQSINGIVGSAKQHSQVFGHGSLHDASRTLRQSSGSGSIREPPALRRLPRSQSSGDHTA
jgi:hypothetical protein